MILNPKAHRSQPPNRRRLRISSDIFLIRFYVISPNTAVSDIRVKKYWISPIKGNVMSLILCFQSDSVRPTKYIWTLSNTILSKQLCVLFYLHQLNNLLTYQDSQCHYWCVLCVITPYSATAARCCPLADQTRVSDVDGCCTDVTDLITGRRAVFYSHDDV